MTNEIWKPVSKTMYWIPNMVNEDYEVSNFGNIRNKKTGKKIATYSRKDYKKLFWTNHKNMGHYHATLQFLVDHTVYTAFIGNCYEKHIKHRDGNPFNNHIDNLYI